MQSRTQREKKNNELKHLSVNDSSSYDLENFVFVLPLLLLFIVIIYGVYDYYAEQDSVQKIKQENLQKFNSLTPEEYQQYIKNKNNIELTRQGKALGMIFSYYCNKRITQDYVVDEINQAIANSHNYADVNIRVYVRKERNPFSLYEDISLMGRYNQFDKNSFVKEVFPTEKYFREHTVTEFTCTQTAEKLIPTLKKKGYRAKIEGQYMTIQWD